MRFYIIHIWVRLNTFGIYVIKYIASINSFFQVIDVVYRNALYRIHMSVNTIKLIHYSSLANLRISSWSRFMSSATFMYESDIAFWVKPRQMVLAG